MKNIVLIGFMGTGKTSTGKLLANRLSRPFLDTDKKIEIENNITIAEMFQQYGETYFRQKEKAMIAKVAR
jgi:shikimate kinase